MKLPDNIISTNIELSCLGKTVPITSPEVVAAEKCMADVESVRLAAGQSAADSYNRWGILSGNTSEQNARDGGEQQVNSAIKDYVLGKPNGWAANLLEAANPQSFEDLERQFFKKWNSGSQ
jgi:hypothetical protein